jgi:hypothetical protein
MPAQGRRHRRGGNPGTDVPRDLRGLRLYGLWTARGASGPSIVALFLGALSMPVQAQTYDPHYPICLQTYSVGGATISCRYPSMEVCQAVASGRGAQCISNPYYAAAPARRKSRNY